MARSPADDAFAAFRRHGDADAMAEVFDLIAPKLLLLAMHLTHDAAAAEDLVQATFLDALRDAQAWDAQGPLLAWLVGILHNRARARRKHEGIRRTEPLPPSDTPTGEPGPLDAALDAEIAEQVGQALDALPHVYRHTLILRLVHGLSAVEIAHALGEAPGTVRMRMQRGLRMLRERLPKGLAVPAVLALGDGRGLAAVREAVLARAAAKATAASGTAASSATVMAFGGLMTKKGSLVVAMLVAALAVSSLVWTPFAAHEAPAAQSASASGIAASATGAPASEAASAADTVAPRTDVTVTPPRPPAAALVVRGRCVASEDGGPLAGCDIEVEGEGEHTHTRSRTGGRSRPDGTFTVASSETREPIHVIVTRADRMTLKRTAPQPTGDEVDIGDIVLDPGVLVRGLAHQEDGTPVSGLRILFEASDIHDFAFANSKDDGTFAADRPVSLSPHRLRLLDDDWDLVEPRTVEPDGAAPFVDLVVRRPTKATMRGVVVDADGQPLPDVLIDPLETWRDGSAGEGSTTDAEGRFVVQTKVPTAPVRLRVMERGARMLEGESRNRQVDLPGPYARGRDDVRLVVDLPELIDGVQVAVVDAETGEPVTRYGVRLAAETPATYAPRVDWAGLDRGLVVRRTPSPRRAACDSARCRCCTTSDRTRAGAPSCVSSRPGRSGCWWSPSTTPGPRARW